MNFRFWILDFGLRKTLWVLMGIAMIMVTFGSAGVAWAQTPSLHPTFAMLDENGLNVLESGEAVSTMKTCGACHDTAYIESHSSHTNTFGKWNPLTYRYVTPQGDAKFDLSATDWLQLLGERYVGGKIVELNCFLCHTAQPDNQARLTELKTGNFHWVNTAVLSGTGLVIPTKSGKGWQWNPQGFDEKGQVATGFVKAPSDENCGLCHGIVHTTPDPLITTACQIDEWSTLTSGQIFSPQRLKDSGLNLVGKEELSQGWDIHAQRLVNCVGCHYSTNNPIYYQESPSSRPGHLKFDSRRRDINEYLYRPSHEFVKGQSMLISSAVITKIIRNDQLESMRRCESCHSVELTHDWLPYKERHLNALSCETCHIPKIYAPAAQQVDWTVLTSPHTPHLICRGVEGTNGDPTARITGYEPLLLPCQEINGCNRLTPYNLLTAWFWVYGNSDRPVRLQDLQAVYFDGQAYRPEIVTLLDNNGDGKLNEVELKLDTPAKVEAIKTKLVALGLENPYIRGEIQPYGVHHDVTNSEWVTQKCEACHRENSRLTQPLLVASYRPSGVMPEFVKKTTAQLNGQLYLDEQGQVMYRPSSQAAGLYVLGHDSNFWANWLGILAVVGTMLGVSVHGGLRIWAARQFTPHESVLKKVYMYSTYKRFWHWLQATAIIALIVTGLVIHLPDMFSMVNFWLAVQVHNIVAFIVVANAFLAAFYHFASGEIRQYLPEPQDFFSQAIDQSLYYLQGIFQGAPHPFEKSPDRKLNPLQQITYLMILNVLLPLQVITGILMWGAQRWPDLAARLGGLTLLGPFHSLIAWLFVAFLMAHMYLTTTGHAPFSLIKAMVVGWEEVETVEK